MKTHLIFVLIILFTVGLNTISQKFLKQRWNFGLGYGLPALGMILFMWKASTPVRHEWFGDLGIYYKAGSIIIENPSNLFISTTNLGFVNIPIIALLFTPFAVLERHVAIILFTFLGGLAVLSACYIILRLTNVIGWKKIALIGFFVVNGPLYHSLWYGNLTHFILLLLIAAWFCLEKKCDFVLGIILGIAALIKIPLFLLGIYFALRRRWRVLAGFSVALFAMVGSSLLLFGLDLHLAWYHQCIQPFAGKALATSNVQSVDGFLARLLYGGDIWWPIVVGWRFKVIRYALLSLLVGTTIWVCWRSKPPKTLEAQNLEFSIVLCLALLISPVSWTHYYLFLLLPFALYIGNRLAVSHEHIWSRLVLASIFLTSLPAFPASPANPVVRFLYSRLLISHYFFGGVLLLGVLLAARWQSSKRSELSSGHVKRTDLDDPSLNPQ
jgi:hypothetical protein